MKQEDIVKRLRLFLEENFLYMRGDFDLKNDTSLVRTGIIDSMGVIELLYFIEEEFGVQVVDEDVTEANLGTINAVAGYVIGHSIADERQRA
ncbi:MAG: acyl carrier protein [Gemmatimonadota bacterium]